MNDTPFYKRSLDSFSDETITRAFQSQSGSYWYACLDVGPVRYVSDPDFCSCAETRETAIALCARKIREDSRGIGKYAPHRLLVPDSYDLCFRLMKHWADKEALDSSPVIL